MESVKNLSLLDRVALPAAVVSVAGYLVLVGSLTAGLAALTVEPGAVAGASADGSPARPADGAGTR